MKKDSLKNFISGGMNTNDAPEVIAPNDYIEAYNVRVMGTGEGGYVANIESTEPVTETTSLPTGIIKAIGGGEFDDIQQAVIFRYASFGNNQILLYDYASNQLRAIFTDQTNSGGQTLLPLDPENYVKAILINETYLIWAANNLEVGYTNLKTLASGGYGPTILAEDFSLIKPQCLIPPTGVYGSDAGQPVNALYGKLPQFIVQYVNADYNYSAWSTRSKRIVPVQQNTPNSGADVTKNNYIIVSVNIGSIRATTINIGCRMGTGDFSTIKSVDRSYVTALTHTAVDVPNFVYEAYDPATNLYSFAFYNNNVSIPIAATTTDEPYPYIWPSNTIEKINGNIIGLADFKTLYARPTTPVSITAVGYNPNIGIPVGTIPDPFRAVYADTNVDTNNKKFKSNLYFAGTPHTGDEIKAVTVDTRNANNIIVYDYVVPSSQNGNVDAVLRSFTNLIPRANHSDGTYNIQFVGPEYYKLQSLTVYLAFAGAQVSNSIPTVLDNCEYQVALAHFDKWGRYLPLETNEGFKVVTPSYAQLNGNAAQIAWSINNATAPTGAVSYQWLITKPPVNNLIDVMATPLGYKGTWDAYNNMPPLAANTGVLGDTYQITNPSSPSDTGHYINLGSGGAHNTGDYITFNGQSWDIIPKSFGDLTTSGDIVAFSLNSLKLFNNKYSDLGTNTVLAYDFSTGDRCTLHYYIDGGNNVYLNNPCVNLAVLGYDAGNYIVKVEKSATFDIKTNLTGKNVFLRLYSPAQSESTASATQNSTVWYEIGLQYPIINGQYSVLSGVINDGGAYFKTRQYADAIHPYLNPPIQTLSTDLNYSDFYPSQFSSFGRPRTYYDELEQTERKASIITSQNYILGSKQNGLTTFYQADIYGESNGQTSSSKGAIQVLWQRGQVLVAIQETGIAYIPVNEAYVVLNEQITGQSISEKLLNNCRYDSKGIGIGKAKEAFVYNENVGWMIDPNRSEPFELTIGGVNSIAGKMSKHFKSVFANAYAQGKKIVLIYNRYYNEVMVCVQADGGMLTLFPFTSTSWQYTNGFSILPSDITAVNNGAHCTVSWNMSTGKATYTPTAGYIGADKANFIFNANAASHTVNNCLSWTAGTTTPTGFAFGALTNQPLSTVEQSNIILVGGINVPVPISIVGGQYSINGGAFTSVAGTVSNGDTVQVQTTSSASSSTETHADLTISTITQRFSVTTGSIVVNPFSFTAQVGVQLATGINSNAITVAGNTIPSPISISGGTYSINGGPFIATAGTVNAGDTVVVKQTSSGFNNTMTSATLTIDGQSAIFNVTTYFVNSFTFTAQTGLPLSTLTTSNTDTLSGSSSFALPISVSSGGAYSINGGAFTSSAGTINIGDTFAVQGTSPSSASTTNSVTLTIAYQTGTFSMTTQALPPDAVGILVVDMYTDSDLNVIGYVNTSGTTPYQQPAYVGHNFQPTTGTVATAGDCWVLASDAVTDPTLKRRFEFNIAKLLTVYPSATTFQFVISGRKVSSGTVNGQYNLKGAAAGNMIMGGSPGAYVPSTSSTVNIGTVTYSGQPIVGGADGTYGIGIGAVILTFNYDVATKTITLTP